MMMMMEDYY
jgi:Reverse transcriptase (RNA-dependent DNA polymerase)